MAHIRTKAELDALPLTPAEEKLIDACQKGEYCELGDGSLPVEGKPDPQRHIHASVLRYLILGGCDDCRTDDIGVWVKGAHVTETLDLDFTVTRGAIRLPNCRFEQLLDMAQTTCKRLELSGCDLKGVRAQSLITPDGVDLDNLTTSGVINFASAIIGGMFTCRDATFNVLNDDAFYAQGAEMKGGLIWRNNQISNGTLNFVNAHIHLLSDELSGDANWPSGERVNIAGMTYNTILAAPTDAKSRLPWLEKGSWWNGEFFPQPYTQLAKVLRDMGHDSDARTVLLERDRLLGPSNRARLKMIPDGTWKVAFLSLWYDLTHPVRIFIDFMFRIIAGYGHRPFRSIPLLIALIMITIIPAHYAWVEGSFAPNSAILQESQGWQDHQSHENPAQSWSDKDAPGHDWETFNRYAYGLDVVIPIINFGQTEAWAPSTNRGWWGKQLYWARWVLGAMGWIVTALGAAAITGVIRRD